MDFPDLPARQDMPEPPRPSEAFRMMAGVGQLMAGSGPLTPTEAARHRQLELQVMLALCCCRCAAALMLPIIGRADFHC